MKMEIGTKIRELRVANNESQEGLANKLNISRQAVSKWENNTSLPDHDTLYKIASLYNKKINYFYDDEKPDNTSDSAKSKSLFILDNIFFRIGLTFLVLIMVYVLGPISLFLSVPGLVVSINRRETFWIIIYSVLVFLGMYILVTIFFPGLVPYSIDIQPVDN